MGRQEPVPSRADYGNCPAMTPKRAWQVGRQARRSGAMLADNPFWPKHLRTAWTKGWAGATPPSLGSTQSGVVAKEASE